MDADRMDANRTVAASAGRLADLRRAASDAARIFRTHPFVGRSFPHPICADRTFRRPFAEHHLVSRIFAARISASPSLGISVRWIAPRRTGVATAAGRTRGRVADRCVGGRPRTGAGAGFLLPGAEPLHQDAAALLVGQQAGRLVGPRLVGDLELVAPRAPIGPAQRGVVLAPGRTAARPAGRLLGALVPLAAAVVPCALPVTPRVALLAALLPARRRGGRTLRRRAGEIAARPRDDLLAELAAQASGRHLLDRALGQLAELERPECDPDQAVDLQVEVAQHVAHLAVLALADRKAEPDIGALLTLERRLDRPIMNALDW